MTVFLGALPVLLTILAMAFGARSLYAALLGVGAAVLAIVLSFPVPMEAIGSAVLSWLPILLEVLLIVGGGLLLSDVLRQAGGQAALAGWVRSRSGHGRSSMLPVEHGFTQFAYPMIYF